MAAVTPHCPFVEFLPARLCDSVLRRDLTTEDLPMLDGKIQGIGVVGADLSTDDARKIAEICAKNLIAQAKAACDGDLDKVVRVVKLGGFVRCTPDFTEQPEVVNGASDLMVSVFGDKGRHSRFAVGTNALPRGVAVEVEAVFEVS